MTHQISKPLSADTTISPRTRIEGEGFNWFFLGLATWYVGGLFLDGWAHHHGRVDQSFFTPWHAVFYSGFLATAAALLYAMWHNRRLAGSWATALPTGYGLSLIGSAIFALGGLGDMVWHTLYGIEDGTEALISPSHLILIVGMLLVVSGPLRAAWQQPQTAEESRMPWTAILSATLFLATFSFITMYLHPIYQIYPTEGSPYGSTRDLYQGLGLATIIFSSSVLSGLTMICLRRWPKLPIGFFTVLIGSTTIMMATLEDEYRFIPPLLLAGMSIDLLVLLLKPGRMTEWRLRLFAIGLPLIYFGFYYQTIWSSGLWWSVHVWTGSIFMAGAVGLLVSYLVFPPAAPTAVPKTTNK